MPTPAALSLREWCVVSLAIGAVGAVVVIAHLVGGGSSFGPSQVSRSVSPSQIEVVVSGAVEYPGAYYFSPGVSMREVLKTARLKKSAERKVLYWERCFYTSGSVDVPHKQR